MDVALKPYKKEYDYSYSFGVFPTLELLEARPEIVLKVLLSEAGRKNKGVAKIEGICERHRIRVEVNDRAVERLAPKENADAIGVFKKYTGTLDSTANHLVLVNPSDMGNLGTIVRTALGFDVTNLALVRPAADIFDPKVVRASMGALFNITFQYIDTFAQYRSTFPHNVYPFMTNGNRTLAQARFDTLYSLVFGNESAGLPEEYRSLGTSITIPHSRKIDSLNLTIAVGVALFEASKRDYEGLKTKDEGRM
jgi:TrmH family RNA methyltransferase